MPRDGSTPIGLLAPFAGLSAYRWGIPCRPAPAGFQLAPVLRLYLRTHPVRRVTMLKLLKNLRPAVRLFTFVPADSAGQGVNLCRAEA